MLSIVTSKECEVAHPVFNAGRMQITQQRSKYGLMIEHGLTSH